MPVRPNLVLPAPLTQAPVREQLVSSAEMNAVARLADARIRRGFELGTRGAYYSSRSEFIHALGMIAQALDAEAGSAIHMPAMTDGLRAIEESDDFVARNAQPLGDFDPVEVAARHRTPVLKGMEPGSISGIEALQRYYSYAQERLSFAVGHQPVGAMALHGLGKLHTALARGQSSQTVAAEPKALVYHQAALLVCPWNYMAANELGVLLVSYGRYEQAKAAFHQSLSISRQPTTWRNLAVAHQSSGETELAKLALQEAEYAAAELKRQTGGTGLTATSPVAFVDVETFKKTGEGPGLSPMSSPTTMTASPPATTRKASMETAAPAMRQ
jgi:tetratricopeptide (TPR) repeat protein